MGDTLEAIGDRLSPERVVQRRKAALGQGFRRMREAVMGSPDYEEPMMARVRGQAQGAASSAGEAAKSAASGATEMARSAAERVQQAPAMVVEQARGNPLAAGLVAFGAGLLFASAFPKTGAEQQLVDTARPQLDAAKEELRGASRELAADVREQTKSAAHDVASSGREAASQISDEAKSAAQRVKGEATG
jgi:gas vesicle protein